MRLLYYSAFSFGGLADYAHEQASALVATGADLTMLAPAHYRKDKPTNYPVLRSIPETPLHRSIIQRKLSFATGLFAAVNKLASTVEEQKFSRVLLGSYSEYLAPFWSRHLRALRAQGVVFGAVVHDPVRDFQLGPRWWHQASIAAAYSFLREAFVHEKIDLHTGKPMPNLRVSVVPHGQYAFPPATHSSPEVRKRLNIPASATVLLAFGHIRDGKNLDLVLQTMREFPTHYLVVAGKEQSSGQRPMSFYQQLAAELGVSDRCRWMGGFIPEDEIGDLFEMADLVVITYSRAFRSASAVLNTAAWYRKPCLASSGEGNLRSTVQEYRLGEWVEPDDVSALKVGLQRLRQDPPTPRWDDYAAEHSWTRNAAIVLDKMA